MTASCLASTILLLLVFAIFAPGFLFTEDATRKADAVILFVGPGNEARVFEARQLITDGYARYLLIPSSGEVLSADKIGKFEKLSVNLPQGDRFHKIRLAVRYGKHYENTHIEALEAKRMMDDMGLRSAILVSSGYHMRRIRLIAGRVFAGSRYSFSCNPAKWQQAFTATDWLDGHKRKIMVSEYVKIGWFLVYGVFS